MGIERKKGRKRESIEVKSAVGDSVVIDCFIGGGDFTKDVWRRFDGGREYAHGLCPRYIASGVFGW